MTNKGWAMTRLQFAILSAVILAGGAACRMAERSAQIRLLQKTEGVRILGKKTLSQDEAVLDLYFEGDEKSREFLLRRFGDEWRVTGLLFIFN